MRLSDAMLLGSTTTKMERGNWSNCALGVAANAAGIARPSVVRLCGVTIDTTDVRVQAIYQRWPWLREPSGGWWGNDRMHEITQAFDYQVAVPTAKMTLEQLIARVRAAEPECGECCQRACACQAVPEPDCEMDLCWR